MPVFPILLIVGLFVAYELITRAQSPNTPSATAAGATTATTSTTSATPPPPTGVQLPGYTDVVGGGGPSVGETTTVSAVGASLNFVPFVGPALSAAFSVIAGGLMAASAKRAAAARNENQAVAAAVPGWDQGMAQTVNAYNSGQITLSEVYQLIMVPQSNDSTIPSGQGVLWKAFWQECGGQIQAGRNGCQSGTVIQGSTQSFCSGGSYGASCCVGYDNLKNSSVYAMQAAKAADAGGGSVTSKLFPTVFASKYGGINRNGYTVTFKKPSAAVSTIAL